MKRVQELHESSDDEASYVVDAIQTIAYGGGV
jgi:hypothetical protein